MNNIYGGFFYPGTPFIFDTFYQNRKTMISSANNDNILVGRYVLVRYCEAALSAETKAEIEKKDNDSGLSTEQKQYYINFQEDNKNSTGEKRSYDRVIFRKGYDNITGKFIYEEILQLENEAVSVNDSMLKEEVDKKVTEVLNSNENNIVQKATLKWQHISNNK